MNTIFYISFLTEDSRFGLRHTSRCKRAEILEGIATVKEKLAESVILERASDGKPLRLVITDLRKEWTTN